VRVPHLFSLSWIWVERLRTLCGVDERLKIHHFSFLSLWCLVLFRVREWEPSVCIRDLHLVVLENLCDWGFLVTLGDCYHLDGWVVCDSVWSTREDCAVLQRRICEGYCAHPAGIVKSNYCRARREGRQVVRPGQVLELVISIFFYLVALENLKKIMPTPSVL